MPVGKLGLYLPRTISTALSDNNKDEDSAAFHVREGEHVVSCPTSASESGAGNRLQPPRPLYRIGRSVIGGRVSRGPSATTTPQSRSPRPGTPTKEYEDGVPGRSSGMLDSRTIRFPDEAPHGTANFERDSEAGKERDIELGSLRDT